MYGWAQSQKKIKKKLRVELKIPNLLPEPHQWSGLDFFYLIQPVNSIQTNSNI